MTTSSCSFRRCFQEDLFRACSETQNWDLSANGCGCFEGGQRLTVNAKSIDFRQQYIFNCKCYHVQHNLLGHHPKDRCIHQFSGKLYGSCIASYNLATTKHQRSTLSSLHNSSLTVIPVT